MSDYITLDRKSPDFESYLKGTFSRDQRALPTKSLNVNSEQERVTFQIVPLSQISKPNNFLVWLKVLRIRSFLVVLFPLFLVLMENMSEQNPIDSWTLLFSSFGVVGLFASINLRNDYVDHMKGFDRIDAKLGSRPIQSGWVTAESVRRLSFVFLFLAGLAALPIMLAFPSTWMFVVAAAAIAYVTLFQLRKSFKEVAGGELGILFLVGPLLACGFELSISGQIREETVFMGIIWGWMALLPVHLRNLELIVGQSQAGVSNLITYFGFDKGKKFIYYWWLAAALLFIAYHYLYEGFLWAWVYAVVVLLLSLRFSRRLLKLQSPVGSEMDIMIKQGTNLLNAVMALWIFEAVWKLWL